MNQFVNAALAAIRQGDKNKAIEHLKQAIAANQNDVDAWLVLSAVLDQSERKRQCLNRVLTLDPANKIAREEMLKLDRAAMANTVAPQLNSPPQERPVRNYYSQAAILARADAQTVPPPVLSQPSQKPAALQKPVEKPQVFRYPILILLATYLFAAMFFLFNILAIQDTSMVLGACMFSLMAFGAIWVVSAKVEVSGEGITSSSMYGLLKAHAKWDEIKSIKSAALGNTLNLVTADGSTVKVTSQVSGYPKIVTLLRERRPDLFGLGSQGFAGNSMRSADGYENFDQPMPAFTGKKEFRKSWLAAFGSYIITVPLLLVSIWTIFTERQYLIGASIMTTFCLWLMVVPLFEITEVQVDGSQITLSSFLYEKKLTVKQIREVRMRSVRRRSVVHHFPELVTDQGKRYSLQGFPEGTEILYGFLLNWWNSYQNR